MFSQVQSYFYTLDYITFTRPNFQWECKGHTTQGGVKGCRTHQIAASCLNLWWGGYSSIVNFDPHPSDVRCPLCIEAFWTSLGSHQVQREFSVSLWSAQVLRCTCLLSAHCWRQAEGVCPLASFPGSTSKQKGKPVIILLVHGLRYMTSTWRRFTATATPTHSLPGFFCLSANRSV